MALSPSSPDQRVRAVLDFSGARSQPDGVGIAPAVGEQHVISQTPLREAASLAAPPPQGHLPRRRSHLPCAIF